MDTFPKLLCGVRKKKKNKNKYQAKKEDQTSPPRNKLNIKSQTIRANIILFAATKL